MAEPLAGMTGPTREGRALPAAVVPMPRMRPATAQDADEIIRLLAGVALEGTLGLDPASLRADEEAARLTRLDLRQACALVVVLAGHVRAFAVAVRGSDSAIAHTATLSIAVDPDCRRRGFGKLLLSGTRAWADAAGVKKLVAGVCEKNAAALALFHRAGFAVEGIRRQQINVGGSLADEVLFGQILLPAGTARPARRERRR